MRTGANVPLVVLVLCGASCAGPERAPPETAAAVSRPAAAPVPTEIPPPVGLERLGWLAGTWVERDPAQGVVVEERWSPPLGGTMLGVGRTVVGTKTSYFEYLRLEDRGDEIVYVAAPKGDLATEFSLTTSGNGLAVFSNPDRDFPRRIVYRRLGDTLLARIEGERDGRPVASEWRLQRE